MSDHFYALSEAGQILAELWYVGAGVLLLFLLIVRRALSTQPETVLPTLSPLLKLLVWPAVVLLAGLIFTDVDEQSQALPTVLMGAVGVLFVANLVHATVQLWRQRSRWGLVGSGLLLELWLCFCTTLSSVFTISGIARHWL